MKSAPATSKVRTIVPGTGRDLRDRCRIERGCGRTATPPAVSPVPRGRRGPRGPEGRPVAPSAQAGAKLEPVPKTAAAEWRGQNFSPSLSYSHTHTHTHTHIHTPAVRARAARYRNLGKDLRLERADMRNTNLGHNGGKEAEGCEDRGGGGGACPYM